MRHAHPLKSLCLGVLLAALAAPVAATPVEVVALFKDRAMLKTADEQVMLRVGETSSGGVTLLAADANAARVRYDGEVYNLALSFKVTSRFAEPEERTVRLNDDGLGQYRSRGSINGRFVDFLVDTGASVVAMSERHARGMGISYENGEPGRVQTAQGATEAYFITLNEVTLGAITVNNVRATVIRGDFPVDVLLGMSFLNQVRMQNEAGVLVLTPP